MTLSILVATLLLQAPAPAAPQCIHLRIERPGLKLLEIGTKEGPHSAGLQFNTEQGIRAYFLDLRIEPDGTVATVVREGKDADSQIIEEFVLRAGEAPRNTSTTPSFGLSLVGTYSGRPYASSCGLPLRSTP